MCSQTPTTLWPAVFKLARAICMQEWSMEVNGEYFPFFEPFPDNRPAFVVTPYRQERSALPQQTARWLVTTIRQSSAEVIIDFGYMIPMANLPPRSKSSQHVHSWQRYCSYVYTYSWDRRRQ
jgi:hypothetical protein